MQSSTCEHVHVCMFLSSPSAFTWKLYAVRGLGILPPEVRRMCDALAQSYIFVE